MAMGLQLRYCVHCSTYFSRRSVFDIIRYRNEFSVGYSGTLSKNSLLEVAGSFTEEFQGD